MRERRKVLFNVLTIAALALAPCFADDGQRVYLWPGDAPGSEGLSSAEVVTTAANGGRSVSNIHRPSITVYLPQENATGASVIVMPGGGHGRLMVDNAGHNIARWLSDHGIAGFVLQYRLAREKNSRYTIEKDASADAQRAIRVIRARSDEWNVDPERIGVMGFSAGGEVAVLAATRYDAGDPTSADPIERHSSRPAFQALVYPGAVKNLSFPDDMPPSFLICGEDDRLDISQGLPELYLDLKRAGASAELHVYAGIGHGFGLGDRIGGPVATWASRFREWLGAIGRLN